MLNALQQNAQDLEPELAWLAGLIDARFNLYFGRETDVDDVFDLTPPDLSQSQSPYARMLAHYQLSFAERGP